MAGKKSDEATHRKMKCESKLRLKNNKSKKSRANLLDEKKRTASKDTRV